MHCVVFCSGLVARMYAYSTHAGALLFELMYVPGIGHVVSHCGLHHIAVALTHRHDRC
jgi:hypothetical protein